MLPSFARQSPILMRHWYEPGLADNGDLDHDLHALLEVAGGAAKCAGTVLVLFIDELQYMKRAMPSDDWKEPGN